MPDDRGAAVKPITVADVHELKAIALEAYKDHYLHLWYDCGVWYIEKSFSIASLTKELNDTNASFYIIYTGGTPCGFLKLNINAPLKGEDYLDALELERIYLTGASTGKGIGRTVFEFVFDLARKLGKQIIWLKAMDSSSDAINFYKKMGFELCGTSHLDFEHMKKEFRGMVALKRKI